MCDWYNLSVFHRNVIESHNVRVGFSEIFKAYRFFSFYFSSSCLARIRSFCSCATNHQRPMGNWIPWKSGLPHQSRQRCIQLVPRCRTYWQFELSIFEIGWLCSRYAKHLRHDGWWTTVSGISFHFIFIHFWLVFFIQCVSFFLVSLFI